MLVVEKLSSEIRNQKIQNENRKLPVM
jgi:hypothetical protein